MLNVTVIQPAYFAGNEPDQKIAAFLLDEAKKAQAHSLILLPEYSNAGGLSDPEKERMALLRAEKMLEVACTIAKEKMRLCGAQCSAGAGREA